MAKPFTSHYQRRSTHVPKKKYIYIYICVYIWAARVGIACLTAWDRYSWNSDTCPTPPRFDSSHPPNTLSSFVGDHPSVYSPFCLFPILPLSWILCVLPYANYCYLLSSPATIDAHCHVTLSTSSSTSCWSLELCLAVILLCSCYFIISIFSINKKTNI